MVSSKPSKVLHIVVVFELRCNSAFSGEFSLFYSLTIQVRDLEAELDLEQRRSRDAAAEAKKFQRQLTELRGQADDDHRLVAELSDHVGTLQTRITTIKRQLEESVCHFQCPMCQ